MSKGLQCGHKETIGKSPLLVFSKVYYNAPPPPNSRAKETLVLLHSHQANEPPTTPLCGLHLASLYISTYVGG